jgi:hypothetical protein
VETGQETHILPLNIRRNRSGTLVIFNLRPLTIARAKGDTVIKFETKGTVSNFPSVASSLIVVRHPSHQVVLEKEECGPIGKGFMERRPLIPVVQRVRLGEWLEPENLRRGSISYIVTYFNNVLQRPESTHTQLIDWSKALGRVLFITFA